VLRRPRQEKAQARNDLNIMMASLRSVDTAYASGNAAEALRKFVIVASAGRGNLGRYDSMRDLRPASVKWSWVCRSYRGWAWSSGVAENAEAIGGGGRSVAAHCSVCAI
jgi:hypothetical protein